MVGRWGARDGRTGRVGARRRGWGLEEEKMVVRAMLSRIASRIAGCRYRGAPQTRIGARP